MSMETMEIITMILMAAVFISFVIRHEFDKNKNEKLSHRIKQLRQKHHDMNHRKGDKNLIEINRSFQTDQWVRCKKTKELARFTNKLDTRCGGFQVDMQSGIACSCKFEWEPAYPMKGEWWEDEEKGCGCNGPISRFPLGRPDHTHGNKIFRWKLEQDWKNDLGLKAVKCGCLRPVRFGRG